MFGGERQAAEMLLTVFICCRAFGARNCASAGGYMGRIRSDGNKQVEFEKRCFAKRVFHAALRGIAVES